ncbi:MAG: TIGR00303 family protein [Pseudanabaenaceae cyanobacterium SKYGB_i_bin29]|nr:TIGR00303 family protein [Pseudanabaenaceae cyanobacterium SKYG29]MDW8420717.1 TIGR00303 family protein [Pseudanabaenaceae cyanobacterium SKYGB_i_bin29]
MIRVVSGGGRAREWLARYRGLKPAFVLVLGFTDTCLIEGISAAGATPASRKTTAIADAEFLYWGRNVYFPLPPLIAGASPVVISRAVVQELGLPLYIFDSGLPQPPTVPTIGLGGAPSRCLSTGRAQDWATVDHLFQKGLEWGKKLAAAHPYLVLSECVAGGTTTALAVLTALGIDAHSKVSSSHPICNHQQKWAVVQQGLARSVNLRTRDPSTIVAAVGDPMQPVIAGMTIGASSYGGVLLGGGSQMVAVYVLAQKLAEYYGLPWQPDRVVVGTTRWVVDDPSCQLAELATELDIPLVCSELHFRDARYPQLQCYEQGFVKEGVGAGASAIVSHLYAQWSQAKLVQEIETTFAQGVLKD